MIDYADFMKSQLAAIISLLVLMTSLLPCQVLATQGTQQPPKLLNLFLGYLLTDDDAAKLAKWDIVVLDMDQQYQFPDQVRRIRELNPKVKILAYVSSSEIAQARFSESPAAPGYDLASSLPESWFVHHGDGSRASWWPGTYLLNASTLCPSSNGQQWNTFLGPWIRDHLISSGLWDGVFLDGAYDELTSRFGADLDPDLDGLINDAKQTDQTWLNGMKQLMVNVRAALGPQALIMNNSSAAYAALVNGTLFENFPTYGWSWPFSQLRAALASNQNPKISAINTNTNNQEKPDDYQLMRYGLTSALVADGYYSFDAGDSNHQRTWWYDEYDISLGAARGTARAIKSTIWSRSYEQGVVLVNSTKTAQAVSLDGEYEKPVGAQDPVTNDGSVVTKATVPAQDGLILLRRSSSAVVHNVQFVNGTFYQVFDTQGTRLRNGFFASRDDVPGGANVLVTDLDRDGLDDLVWSQNGQVTVRLGQGATYSFRPYGTSFRGGIELTAGQTNRDTAWELILAPSSSLSSKILVTDWRGRVLRSWLAYRTEFKGGATIGLGDFDQNGLREIATAAGRGGGPHVRTWKTDGQLWAGGFFAFDASSGGGAYLSVDDVNGDGRDELVLGSGANAMPQIKVYDGHGSLLTQFNPGSTSAPLGLHPVAADINGDGQAEILVPGNPF